MHLSEIQSAQGDMLNTSDNIGEEAVSFFKEQFKETYRHEDDEMLDLISKLITTEQNEDMGRIPSKEEVKEVVGTLNAKSASGPDDFSGLFFQHC